MNRYISFCINFPKTAILILVLLTVALAPGILKLEINNSIETLMPKHDSQYIHYNQVKETFGDNGQFMVLAVSADTLFSADTLSTLDHLVADLEEYMDFDKEAELARLDRLGELRDDDGISTRAIISAFDDDPVFQRLVQRKIQALFADKKT